MHGVNAISDRDAFFYENGGFSVWSTAAGKHAVADGTTSVTGDYGVKTEGWKSISTIYSDCVLRHEREKMALC